MKTGMRHARENSANSSAERLPGCALSESQQMIQQTLPVNWLTRLPSWRSTWMAAGRPCSARCQIASSPEDPVDRICRMTPISPAPA